jgi:hypothetical protein
MGMEFLLQPSARENELVRAIDIELIIPEGIRIGQRKHDVRVIVAEQILVLMGIVKAQLFTSERKRFPVMGYVPDIVPLLLDDPAETDAGGIIEDHDIIIIDDLRHDISLYRGALGVPKVYLVAQLLKKEQKDITDLLDPRSACRIMIHDPHVAILPQAKFDKKPTVIRDTHAPESGRLSDRIPRQRPIRDK